MFEKTKYKIASMLFKSVQKDILNLQKKESIVYNSILKYYGNQVQWTPTEFGTYAKEGYSQNVYVYACINTLTRAISGVDWYLVKKKKTRDGKDEEIENHPLLDLWHKPNPMLGGTRFIEMMFMYLFITGNSFIEKVGARNKPPKELYIHRPDRISIVPGKTLNMVNYYEYNIGGQKKDIEVSNMMHILFTDPLDDWYGMSPLKPASRSVDQNNESRKWNVSLLQNGCRPSGVLSSDKNLSDEQFEDLEETMYDKHSGSDNAEKVLILEGGLKWNQMSINPVDMSWLDGLKLSAREISIAFGVPPELIGDNTNKTYCLPGYTRVMTIDGPKNIKDINIDDKVITIDLKKKKQVIKKVLWQGCVGRKKVIKIIANGRELHCTEQHPILVKETYKINAPMIDKRYSKECRQRLIWKDANDIQIGDTIVSAYKYDLQIRNDIEMNVELAELCGAFIGDGFVKDYDGGRAIISMSGNKNEVRDYYKLLCEKYFTKHDFEKIKIKEHEREFRFISKTACKELNELGVTGTSKTKRIPKWVYNSEYKIKIAFLRGLFDTDGSVDKKGIIKFSVNNINLIYDVRDLCIICGIQVSNIYYSDRETRLPNGREVRNVLWNIYLTVPCLNFKIGSRNKKDIQRLKNNKDNLWKGRRKARIGSNHELECIKNTEYLKVKKIEEICDMDVYDITIEDTHGFFADNVYVHNSNYKEARKALYEETALPLLDWLKDEVNNWLTPTYNEEGLELRYDVDNIEALQEDRDSKWKRVNDSKSLKINEKRQALGYDEITEEEGGNEIIVSSKDMPLSSLLNVNSENNIDDDIKQYNIMKKKYKKKIEFKNILDFIDDIVDYIDNTSSTKIVQINDTTRGQVRERLNIGTQLGESVYQIADRIDELYLDQIIPNRSVVIARTEAIQSTNYGNRVGALATRKDLEMDMDKEWIAAGDNRVRPAHEEADGQVVDLDDPYIVAGEKLLFPGDTSLGASGNNTIQCRCSEGYIPRDDVKSKKDRKVYFTKVNEDNIDIAIKEFQKLFENQRIKMRSQIIKNKDDFDLVLREDENSFIQLLSGIYYRNITESAEEIYNELVGDLSE